ncbi:hypothetical protein CAPTEDRAFT_99843, partial [Capitella teleta]
SVISRSEWGARAPKSTQTIGSRVRYIIHHSTGPSCFSRSACVSRVRSIQNYHLSKWDDIGYNFLVGEDGNAYEGRGWNIKGAHAGPLYNSNSIGICVIGDFTSSSPNAAALRKVQALIKCGVDSGNLTATYKLHGHRDVSNTECNGDRFYRVITEWPNYSRTP